MEKTWLCAAKLQLGLAHRTLPGCAPNSVRSARLVNGEVAALGNRWRCTTIIHRTVRWRTGLSDESSATNSSLSGKEKGDMAIIHRTVRWSTGLSGKPTALAPTIVRAINARHVARSNGRLGAPDSVRCANQPRGATVGCARYGRISRTGQAILVVRWRTGLCSHSTEGKDSLPC
jgi:hypothetical protein